MLVKVIKCVLWIKRGNGRIRNSECILLVHLVCCIEVKMFVGKNKIIIIIKSRALILRLCGYCNR